MRPKPLAVEYSLSRLGRTIIRPLSGMCQWAKRHHTAVSADVYRVEEGLPAANGK
jgi:DNA-binding HxlR family transcriptional regulator